MLNSLKQAEHCRGLAEEFHRLAALSARAVVEGGVTGCVTGCAHAWQTAVRERTDEYAL